MSIAIYYLKLLPDIRAVARSCGYAIGLHGSMTRDFDLIAVPWTDEAKPAEELIEAIRVAVHGTITPDGTPGGRWDAEEGKFVPAEVRNPALKPHGRKAWGIQLGCGSYLDVSVLMRLPAIDLSTQAGHFDFSKLSNGDVRITLTDGRRLEEGGQIVAEATIDAGVWISIVLCMTKFSERPNDWHAFMDHHLGRADLLDMAKENAVLRNKVARLEQALSDQGVSKCAA